MVKSEDTLLQKIIDYKYIGKNYTRKYKMGLISGIHVMYKIDFTKVAAKMNLLQVWDCDRSAESNSDKSSFIGRNGHSNKSFRNNMSYKIHHFRSRVRHILPVR